MLRGTRVGNPSDSCFAGARRPDDSVEYEDDYSEERRPRPYRPAAGSGSGRRRKPGRRPPPRRYKEESAEYEDDSYEEEARPPPAQRPAKRKRLQQVQQILKF
jgi:hypothetical protein